jgi:hypothetical protein
VTLAVNGIVLHGSLIGEERYFAGTGRGQLADERR